MSSSDGVTTVLDVGATWTFDVHRNDHGGRHRYGHGHGHRHRGRVAGATGNGPGECRRDPRLDHSTETASAKKVASGASVTFTYTETNNPGSDPITGVAVTGLFCGPATFVKASTATRRYWSRGPPGPTRARRR